MTVLAPNATLTLIAGAGTTDDWNTGPGADTTRWTGSTAVRVHDRVEVETAQGRVDVLSVTEMVTPRSIGELAQIGDTVTYSWDGATYSREVEQSRVRDIGDTARLWLKNA